MKNVLFLDIDGVMNSSLWIRTLFHDTDAQEGWGKDWKSPRPPFDPYCTARLNRILATGCGLVISSSWGKLANPERLRWEGVQFKSNQFLGYTKHAHDVRGKNIADWLAKHKVDKFKILDDSKDMAELLPQLVWVNPVWGLSTAHADHIINYFQKEQSL